MPSLQEQSHDGGAALEGLQCAVHAELEHAPAPGGFAVAVAAASGLLQAMGKGEIFSTPHPWPVDST